MNALFSDPFVIWMSIILILNVPEPSFSVHHQLRAYNHDLQWQPGDWESSWPWWGCSSLGLTVTWGSTAGPGRSTAGAWLSTTPERCPQLALGWIRKMYLSGIWKEFLYREVRETKTLLNFWKNKRKNKGTKERTKEKIEKKNRRNKKENYKR